MTAVFLGQAALTILQDDLKFDGGVYTPACLGGSFIDRLEKVGYKMETAILEP